METGQYDNTILIVMGDNGGYTTKWSWVDFRGTGSNFPFRGGKGNNLEGGTRVPTFVHSKLLKNIGYLSSYSTIDVRVLYSIVEYNENCFNSVTNNMMHIIDWLPTLLRATGISKSDIAALNLDGIDQVELNKL